MDVVMHIGLNKTGTSAIQKALYTLPPGSPLIYPRAGIPTGQYSHIMFAHEPHRAHAFVREFEKEAVQADAQGVIISTETLHTVPPGPIAEALSSQGHNVHVIAYLRHPVDYLSSWYRQSIKSDITSADFMNFAYLAYKPYYSWLSSWANSFPGKTHIYMYDRPAFPDGSVVKHFFSLLNLPAPEVSPENNPSISGNLLFLKRLANVYMTKEESIALTPEIIRLSQLDDSFRGRMHIDHATREMLFRLTQIDRQHILERFEIDIYAPKPDTSCSTYLSPDFTRLRQDREMILAHTPKSNLFSIILQQVLDGPYDSDFMAFRTGSFPT